MQPLSQAHHIKACLIFKPFSLFKFKYRLSKFSLPLLAIGSLLLLSSPTYAESNSNNNIVNSDLVTELDDGLLPAPKTIDANSIPEHEFEGKQQQSKESSTNVLIGNDSAARATNGTMLKDSSKVVNNTSRQGVLAGGGVTSPAGLIKWLLSTVAILGIIFVLAYVLKKSRLVQRSTGSSMTLVGQMAVGPKERLVQIKVGERHLLLGVTSQNVNLVADLSCDLAKDSNSANSHSKLEPNNNSYSTDNSNHSHVGFFRKNPSMNCPDSLSPDQAMRASKDRNFSQDHLSKSNFKTATDDRDLGSDHGVETSSLEAYWGDPVFSKLLDGADEERYRPNNGRYTKEQLENLGYWFESELDYHEGHNFDINHQQRHHQNSSVLSQEDYDNFDDQDLDDLYKEHLMANRARRRLVRRNPMANDYYAMPNDDILKERAQRAKIDLARSRKFEQKFGSEDDFGTIFNHAYDQAQEKLKIDPIVPQNDLNEADLDNDSLVEEVSVADIERHQELASSVQGAKGSLDEPNNNFELNGNQIDSGDEVEVDVLLAIDEAVENSKPINSQASAEKINDLNQVVMIDDELASNDEHSNQISHKPTNNNRSKYNKSSKRKGRSSKSRNFGL